MSERRMKGSLVWPLIASEFASANGCKLDEGSPHPCIVRGSDIGNTLFSMGLMFWFSMITLPLGALSLLLSLAWLVRRVVSRR